MGTTKRVVFSSSLLKECKDMVASSVIDLLESIAEKSDNPKVTITSTWRNPYRQAMAMYNNLVAGKRIRYREPGRKGDRTVRRLPGSGHGQRGDHRRDVQTYQSA